MVIVSRVYMCAVKYIMLESSLRLSRNRRVISKTQKYTCAYDVFCEIPFSIDDLLHSFVMA